MRRADIVVMFALGSALVAASAAGLLPYGLTETLGFVTGAACVYLVVKENVWNFPLGIANNVFFLVLFWQARLYGDGALQVVYVALGLQGWYLWLYGGENRTALRVERAPRRVLFGVAAFVLAGTLALWLVLRAVKDSAPVLDALTTALSLAAQYLLNRKAFENWLLWITADVLYIYLYLARGLHLTAVLYLVFLCLCVAGLRSWRRSLARQREEAVAPFGPAAGESAGV
jgi:nicotinamide mononucleotide transporter